MTGTVSESISNMRKLHGKEWYSQYFNYVVSQIQISKHGHRYSPLPGLTRNSPCQMKNLRSLQQSQPFSFQLVNRIIPHAQVLLTPGNLQSSDTTWSLSAPNSIPFSAHFNPHVILPACIHPPKNKKKLFYSNCIRMTYPNAWLHGSCSITSETKKHILLVLPSYLPYTSISSTHLPTNTLWQTTVMDFSKSKNLYK